MTKDELRKQVRQLKAEYREQMFGWSQDVARRISLMPQWQQANTILLYHALPDEPSTDSLLECARIEGRRVLLPVVVGDDLQLRLYEGKESLRMGAFHILEPTSDVFSLSRYAEVDLALVPGVAFDTQGYRLGRGRGYYDRLLPRLPRAYKLGVCFPFQCFGVLPHEPHDVPMDEVCCSNS